MATRMQQRRGTATQWTTANPILNAGEIGFESDTNKFKIGDGINHWDDLAYFVDQDSLNTSLGDYIPLDQLGVANGVAQLNSSGKLVSDQIPNIDEITQDAIDSALVGGDGITKTYNDGANTITIDVDITSGDGLKIASNKLTVDDTVVQKRVANVSDTEIGYLDGVTSSIQTQLNAKLASADLTEAAQDAVNTALTAGTGITKTYDDAANTITVAVDTTAIQSRVANVSDTEIGYLDGVTSAIQTQLDNKSTASKTETLTNKTLTSPVINTPTGITKSDVGLANVDNTTDANKPVSTATQTALDLKAPIASPTFTGTVSGVTKTHVGLGNVDNTSDANKPVSTATQTALDLKAPIASPALTGTPTAPTATAGTNTTQVATTAFVGTAVANLVGTASSTLDTLGEIATALGNDANLSTTLTSAIGLKAPIDSPTFTGTVSGVTKSMVGLGNVDNTSDANKPVSTAAQTALDAKLASATAATTYAPIASPTFTGTVSGVTKSMVGLGNVDNTTDANKPVSTATQTALDAKAPLASPTFTGTVSLPANTITNTMMADDSVDTAEIKDSAVTSAKIANGTIVNADINASAAIALSKLATDPLARANHTGTQAASTISDFDTQVRTSKVTDLTAPTGSFSMNTQKITNLLDPTADQDAATKAYVDAATAGLNVHASVKAATTTNVNLTNAVDNNKTLDGYTLSTGDRILVKNQNTASQNGIYIVASNGEPTRATDYDSVPEVDAGDFIYVERGTVNGTTGWVQTSTVTTLGTDSITFTQFSGAGTYLAGTGLTLTGSTFSINTGTTVDLNTAQTLTNKTLTSPTITGTGAIAGTFTGNITGNVTGNVTGSSGSTTGNAATVTNGVYTTDTGTVTNTMLAGSIANSKLSNSKVTVGTTDISLGASATALTGITTINSTTIPSTKTLVVTTDKLSALAATTSSELAGVISDETGSGALVFATSPTLVTPALGTPASGVMTNVTGLPVSTGISGLGTGIATALAVNAGSSGAPVINGGALGTPASGTLTNATGLPLTTGVTGTLPVANGGTGVTTSTGTGSTVLSASPTFTGTVSAADLTLSGNLTVNGTTTTINSTTLSVDDKNIEIGSVDTPTNTTADGGGITLKGTSDKTFNWVNATSAWTSSEHLNLATGKSYYANGTLLKDVTETLTNKTISGASNTLTVRLANDISGFGTGIATALAINTGSAGAPVLFNGALGTPTSGTLTNATGLPLTTGVTGTLPIANGGTGATTASTAAAALLPSQTSNSGKYLTTDGSGTLSWGTVSGYSAPTLGSTSIASGSTVTTINGLTKIVAATVAKLDASGYEQDFDLLTIMGAI